MKLPALILTLAILALLQTVAAQSLPGKMRGYKVHAANVVVTGPSSGGDSKAAPDVAAVVNIDGPKIVDLGLTGLTIEIGAVIEPTGQTGRVDFLTFKDLSINNIAVEIEEYKHTFAFKRAAFNLPVALRVFIRSSSIAKGAFRALIGSKREWAVTGTVFVFGTFKKYGFSFKRVIPVRVDLKIANPLSV